MDPIIKKHNVGRIAERIVANELEYRGFRVSDLNKEGMSANADLLAARDEKTWQIQVKGSSWDDGWYFGYGHCKDATIARTEGMFNRCTTNSFYKAQIIVLVSVKSPNEYQCLVLPVKIAEEAAQIHLDREYRTPKNDGGVRKPAGMWISLDTIPNIKEASKRDSYEAEQKLLKPYRNNWDF